MDGEVLFSEWSIVRFGREWGKDRSWLSSGCEVRSSGRYMYDSQCSWNVFVESRSNLLQQ